MKTQNRVAHMYPQLAIALSLVKHVHEAIAPPLVLVAVKAWACARLFGAVLKHPQLHTQEEQVKRAQHFPRTW